MCFGCGSNQYTQGCLTCNSNTTCTSCLTGLTLDNQNQCTAPVIYQYDSPHKVIYIGLIVLFSLICVVIIGLIGYNCYKDRKSKNNGGLY